MSLPKINPRRLQGVVANVEFDDDFKSFDDLCAAVAKTTWATNLELDVDALGLLMVEHNTITMPPKPESVPPRKTVDRTDRVFPEDRCDRVGTPVGKPPHELKGTSRAEVEEWAECTRRTGMHLETKRFYTREALIYWTRYFYELFSEDWKTVKKHLQEMYADEYG